jgi:uncharacterized FAD-dependent dehydrogenase
MSGRRLPEQLSLELGLDEPDDDESLRRRVARRLRVHEASLPPLELVKRAIDARGSRVRFRLWLRLGKPRGGQSPVEQPLRECPGPHRVIVVGDGPAGRFCAYGLARRGIGCLVLDRGRAVGKRRRDVHALQHSGVLDPESNYCFGEGGAGTYSDGKLYTRSHKRGSVREILELLAVHGAPEAILTDARPHIGSDRLPGVVTRLREALRNVGVEFRFEARVSRLLVRGQGARRHVAGVRLQDGTELPARCVVLATGHNARDVYRLLEQHRVRLAAKAFAVGVRVEHPQALIDRIQYGKAAGHPRLPAASYRLAREVGGRTVFSFCMCPGGFVVPATTEFGELVVNGMSRSRRDAPHANCGLVVGVGVRDLVSVGSGGPRGGVELQRQLERAAWTAGGGGLRAPATRVTDFVRGGGSTTLPPSSYRPGLSAGDVSEVLDPAGLGLSECLREALRVFDRDCMRGYLTEEAVLIGVETRTSAPLRVPRDRETLQCPDLVGLYPCGEGAGYAGGIVSAALDGMRVARHIARELADAGSSACPSCAKKQSL